MSSLVHLHVHSVHSHRHSLLKIAELVSEAKRRGHQAVALTDMDGVYGLVPFVQAARAAGIRPVIGADLQLQCLGSEKPGRVTLLARNDEGFRNLSRLISHHHLHGRAGVSAELLAAHAQGLIFLSGGQHGAIPRLLAQGFAAEARAMLETWREAAGSRHCYVQLGPWWPAAPMAELAESLGIGVVAAQEASYLHPQQERDWKLLIAGHGLGHPAPGPRHLALDEELMRAFGAWPEAISNTRLIAGSCTYEPSFGISRLPRFAKLAGTAREHLRRLCEAGLVERYASSPRYEEAKRRMDYELDVIDQKQFNDYFLIAWDLARFARVQGIPHIPRGSAAGSLILYLLGVSQICPIEHTLCFERFLNPERRTPPDIDLDFDWRRRDEVVDYCFALYGHEHVARIATHQHHGPRGAVRLAGAAHGLEPESIDKLARRVPRFWDSGPADVALKTSDYGDIPIDQEPWRSVLETALVFNDLPDHLGLHPCGIVISQEPLEDVVPLEVSAKGPIVTQFEMTAIEAQGLLKMDLLANRNLAILQDVIALIHERHGVSLDPETIPLADPKAFELLRTGRTHGIYQMESGGVQGLLRQFQPTHIEDITAITSLYRPGPLEGKIKQLYVERRHGREAVKFPDPCLEGVLGHTFGLILYQEQCLQVTSVFAGMSMGQSDNLRRGIAKRIKPEVERIRQPFFEGAKRLGRDQKVTAEVWELLANFAGYGFVKAHAASCAALAIREAYVKARWPLEYLACVLATGQGYYEPRVYIEDARAFGATIALPCINRSEGNYTVEGGGVLRIGLAYLHGLGPAGVQGILEGREQGAYRNLLDLKRRSGLSRPELEILIRIGACDVLGVSRSALMHQLSDLPKARPTPGQLSLFLDLPPEPAADFGHYPLQMQQAIERELLGFTVTVPPLPKEVGALTLGEAKLLPRRSRVSVVAEVVSRFGTRTKQGKRMSFLTLSDRQEHCQAVLFPEAYRKWSSLSRRGAAALFHGVLELEGGEPMIIISEVESLYDRWGVS